MLFFFCYSNPKHFSSFVFDTNESNKISSTPIRLLNFQKIFQPPRLFQPLSTP